MDSVNRLSELAARDLIVANGSCPWSPSLYESMFPSKHCRYDRSLIFDYQPLLDQYSEIRHFTSSMSSSQALAPPPLLSSSKPWGFSMELISAVRWSRGRFFASHISSQRTRHTRGFVSTFQSYTTTFSHGLSFYKAYVSAASSCSCWSLSLRMKKNA